MKSATCGLSPRLRGTGQGCSLRDSCLAVYPRACGERKTRCSPMARSSGLSPRLRGTAFRQCISGLCDRFIPAPAGNGLAAAATATLQAVYPRACGERRGSTVQPSNSHGLSPRLRGTGRQGPDQFSGTRFIPAPAGNGPRHRQGYYELPVYPRACGERAINSLVNVVRGGLSPRLRGTAAPVGRHTGPARFIPAPAGNGLGFQLLLALAQVYPRACGERTFKALGNFAADGLSPRLRGTVVPIAQRTRAGRFIPAPAGNGCTTITMP